MTQESTFVVYDQAVYDDAIIDCWVIVFDEAHRRREAARLAAARAACGADETNALQLANAA